jgi:hypothetical protein
MRAIAIRKEWDREIADFVEIPVPNQVDVELSCGQCRYYNPELGICGGVGSRFYTRRVRSPDFVPRIHECDVRLPPDLLSFA